MKVLLFPRDWIFGSQGEALLMQELQPLFLPLECTVIGICQMLGWDLLQCSVTRNGDFSRHLSGVVAAQLLILDSAFISRLRQSFSGLI